jgi:hypothetical protein
VSSYRLLDPSWAQAPFEGRHPATFKPQPLERTATFPAGTVVVDCAQRRARVVAHLLEPEAPDALVKWGFFDTIFEAKEYAESYVMEGIAREMLQDSVQARAFALAAWDTALTNHPDRVRRWFYQRSPHAETRVGVYPVARVGPAP